MHLYVDINTVFIILFEYCREILLETKELKIIKNSYEPRDFVASSFANLQSTLLVSL